MTNPRIPQPSKDVVVVSRVVPAPPAEIFAILADPTRHQEIDGSGTVRAAGSLPDHLRLGSTFEMKMHWGVGYEMVNTVVELEPDAVIAWQPRPKLAPLALLVGGRIWKYVLEPVDGGTLVTEIWDIRAERMTRPTRRLAPTARAGMTKTLERLADRFAA